MVDDAISQDTAAVSAGAGSVSGAAEGDPAGDAAAAAGAVLAGDGGAQVVVDNLQTTFDNLSPIVSSSDLSVGDQPQATMSTAPFQSPSDVSAKPVQPRT